MIRRFFCAVFALFCMVTPPASGEAVYSDLIRLHVVAEDDSAAAQKLKLELRDVCLRCAEVCIGDAEDADTAYMRLERHLEDFRQACEDRARELGFEGEIAAEAGTFDFPDRIYGDARVPAGKYRALRITIGGGEGRNWWCVLYPNLCALDEIDYAGGKPVVYSKILRWIGDKIGGLK